MSVKEVSQAQYDEIVKLLETARALELEAKGQNLRLRDKLDLLTAAKRHRDRAMEIF